MAKSTAHSNTPSYILAIDQGTTSTRAFLLDETMRICGVAQQEFEQHFPNSGWVEHDVNDIWGSVLTTCQDVIQHNDIDIQAIRGIGITNQRETVIAWHKTTLEPVYNAIVWQDRRGTAFCDELRKRRLDGMVQQKTGLLVDPYFSASKMRWILHNVPEARALCDEGLLCFGTVDSYLIAKLSGGAHVTDVTNASRTQLFNIQSLQWDPALCDVFEIPMASLPAVQACDSLFAHADAGLFGAAIPICGVAGDQQAALIGQGCFNVGDIKSTYGTGCFALLNTGTHPVQSNNRLLTTVAYQIDGEVHYALEGSIFVAGAAIQWLRDGLQVIDSAAQSEACAQQADEHQSLFLVPAFTGLGAPYWNSDARGALFGITRATSANELCKAALESIVYQSVDLFTSMHDDLSSMAHTSQGGALTNAIRVDGGMVANDWLMQFLADMLNTQIDVPNSIETTVLGAAYLAGKHLGMYNDVRSDSNNAHIKRTFTPSKDAAWRAARLMQWHAAVNSTLQFHQPNEPSPS
ncbi:MAG: glycerol kinase GlpK [Pseudomonadota bacterium]